MTTFLCFLSSNRDDHMEWVCLLFYLGFLCKMYFFAFHVIFHVSIFRNVMGKEM